MDQFAIERLLGELEATTWHELRQVCDAGWSVCRSSFDAGRTWLADSDLDRFVDSTVTFQRTLIEATGNGWLIQARAPLDLVDRMVRARARRMPLGRALGAWQQQRRLLRALRHGDRAAALAALRARDARDLADALRVVRAALPGDRLAEQTRRTELPLFAPVRTAASDREPPGSNGAGAYAT